MVNGIDGTICSFDMTSLLAFVTVCPLLAAKEADLSFDGFRE